MTAYDKISRARTQILLANPFWASLMLRLKIEPFPKDFFTGPYAIYPHTMATDGNVVLYDEDFVNGLKLKHLETVLAHETAHAFLCHVTRRGGRHPIGWNLAADAVTNLLLKECGFEMPPGCVPDEKYKDMSAEQVYNLMAKEARQKGKSGKGDGGQNGPPEWVFGEGSVGQMVDGDLSEAQRSQLEQEWQGAAEQAAKTAKQAGRLPGSLERLVTEVRAPKVDWITQLRRFMEATIPRDYRWFPPNRRYVASGIYLPSVLRENLGQIVVIIDTSGSIGQAQLKTFCSELNHIVNQTNPERVYVLYVDTQVQRVEEFGMGEEITMSAKGGGGTDFVPGFKWIDKEGLTPKCCIYLTDLECSSYPAEPEFPTLWVTDSEHQAKFGETIQITIEEQL